MAFYLGLFDGFWCNNFADVARESIRRVIRTYNITRTQDSKPVRGELLN